MYSGEFNIKIIEDNSSVFKKSTSKDIIADYAGGIIGEVKGLKDNNIQVAESTFDYNVRDTEFYNNSLVELSMNNCYNYANISPNAARSGGMIGIYSGLYSMKFNSCLNAGTIYNKNL